jgi:hypothetical protein
MKNPLLERLQAADFRGGKGPITYDVTGAI